MLPLGGSAARSAGGRGRGRGPRRLAPSLARTEDRQSGSDRLRRAPLPGPRSGRGPRAPRSASSAAAAAAAPLRLQTQHGGGGGGAENKGPETVARARAQCAPGRGSAALGRRRRRPGDMGGGGGGSGGSSLHGRRRRQERQAWPARRPAQTEGQAVAARCLTGEEEPARGSLPTGAKGRTASP